VKITILGSGTSHGVPMIGCRCPVCTSDNPKNRRRRASALVTIDNHNVLIDTSVELRLQAVDAGLDHVDAVLMTHQHADHISGFDDLRRFCSLQQAAIPCYGNAETIARLRHVYDYAIASAEQNFFEIPVVEFITVDRPFDLLGHTVTPVPLVHGRWPCNGYRLGDLAYCTDVRKIPPASMDLLRGLDVLVLGALRHRPHVTHFTVEQALEVVADLKPQRTFLTHLGHDLDYDATNAALPSGVRLAWDGLTLDLPDPV